MSEQSTDETEQTELGGEQTVEVVVESTGHRKYEVPISDVDRESVSLENAELVEERVHGDPMATRRKDTGEEVERRD